MKAAVENYKGIEFVRISALPEDQKRLINDSALIGKVIKVLRGKELLNDCLPYQNYIDWYRQSCLNGVHPVEKAKDLRLAFK